VGAHPVKRSGRGGEEPAARLRERVDEERLEVGDELLGLGHEPALFQ
jgi:hypothetical protein